MSNEALLAASSYGAVPEGCLGALPLRAAFADAQDSGNALDAFEDYKAEGPEGDYQQKRAFWGRFVGCLGVFHRTALPPTFVREPLAKLLLNCLQQLHADCPETLLLTCL